MNITNQQRINLKKLACYLLDGIKEGTKFDMAVFESGGSPYDAATCGSVGCAVGHGPYAGVPKEEGERWGVYAHRAFSNDDLVWLWCFSTIWSNVDNTPEGAAKRILHYLDKGVPSDIYNNELYTNGRPTY